MKLYIAAFLLALTLLTRPVLAAGLDRDSLLTEAPATPDKGTVRVTGMGGAQVSTDASQGSSGQVSGAIQWTPFESFSADVGAYYQVGGSGPSARVRYQILSQQRFGIDLAGGVRMKTVGFHPDQGEVEMMLAAGRSFGKFDLVLNGVFGVETGGGQGKDIELKAFAGYRFNDAVRAGFDGRLQAEVSDEAKTAGPKLGRDFDLMAGPAVSWMAMRQVQLQALVGVAAPKGSDRTLPVGLLALSMDF